MSGNPLKEKRCPLPRRGQVARQWHFRDLLEFHDFHDFHEFRGAAVERPVAAGLRPEAAEEPVAAELRPVAAEEPEEPVQRPRLTYEQGRVKPWINKVRRNVKKSHPRFHPTNQPTIFMPPANISQINRAAYEPSLVSIGPLHGRHVELQNCKWRFMRCLLSRCGDGSDASRILDECLMDLKARDAEVRGCYSVNLGYIDPCKLATMMLLDGCFIIYLMLRRQGEGDACSVVISPHRLETLEGSAEQGMPNLTGESIVVMVDKVQESRMKEQQKEEGMFMCVPELDLESVLWSGSESESVVDIEIGGAESFDGSLLGNLWTWNLIVYDLLKLGNQIPFFVIRLIFDKLFKTPTYHPGNGDQLTDLALNLFSDIHPNKSIRFRKMPSNKINHLLHLFHSSIITDWQVSQPAARADMHGAGATPEWIPNATDLAMAGVKFKCKETFNSFLDVSFKNGILEIPPLGIYDYTESLFRNLIAFEQCYPDTNTEITIYANFMDCIIDTSNDARLLYTKGILINGLSTDDKVASLFNQLCNQIHFDPRKNYLNDLFIQVNEYHGSRWHQWLAGLVRDYFSNPWVIISVLAAVLLLLLTIEQSFFAAFSYFRPP